MGFLRFEVAIVLSAANFLILHWLEPERVESGREQAREKVSEAHETARETVSDARDTARETVDEAHEKMAPARDPGDGESEP